MMRTVFTTVLWAFGFDSYQTQLTLMGHGYSIERDTVEECSVSNASCECYTVCVLYICHGWAPHDENSFHDGLMSFWLWFLPNSAHSDGQVVSYLSVLFCMPLDKGTETAHFWMQGTFDLLHPESPWGVYYGLLVLGACKYSCQLRLWPCYFPSTLHFVNAGWYRSMEQVFGTVLLERKVPVDGTCSM